MKRSVLRSLLLLSVTALPMIVFTCPANAQKPVLHELLLRLEGLDGRDQEKAVLAAIDNQDPAALATMDVATQAVKVRTFVQLDRTALELDVAPFGVTILSLGPISVPVHSERVSPAVALPGFPTYTDTGDPESDAATYSTNKTAWIQAHPELYPPVSGPSAPSSTDR